MPPATRQPKHRPAPEPAMNDLYLRGVAAGRTWAGGATGGKLRRLRERHQRGGIFAGEPDSRWGWAGIVAGIAQSQLESAGHIERFWFEAVGPNRLAVMFEEDFVRGFVAGVVGQSS